MSPPEKGLGVGSDRSARPESGGSSSAPAGPAVTFPYTERQRFRPRHGDLNIMVVFSGELPVRRATWRLNGGRARHLYVEPDVPVTVGPYAWNTNSPSVFRLQGRPGWANVEIPVDDPELRVGVNDLAVRVVDATDDSTVGVVLFDWDPTPVPLPLDLPPVTGDLDLLDVAQPVNGVFEVVPGTGAIRSVEPVGADSLLLIGSPAGSQEATYCVQFDSDGRTGTYVGLSDFFHGHPAQDPDLGIKPGYSTAGLATISPGGWGQLWMARGDCLVDMPWAWLVRSRHPARFPIKPGVPYRVRHQCFIEPGLNLSRFRVWEEGSPEPAEWLCVEDTRSLAPQFERLPSASFGLFQYGGQPTTWSDISVRELHVTDAMIADAFGRPRRRVRGELRRIDKALRDRVRWRLAARRDRRSASV